LDKDFIKKREFLTMSEFVKSTSKFKYCINVRVCIKERKEEIHNYILQIAPSITSTKYFGFYILFINNIIQISKPSFELVIFGANKGLILILIFHFLNLGIDLIKTDL